MSALPDRYDLIAALPGGGMADTLHCRDKTLERDVVIKRLKAGISAQRLLDELAALSAIRSRYVVEIYDVIRDDQGEVVAVVEEYLSGNALTPCAAGSSSDAMLRAIYPVAAGVCEIHDHGRVHRDIKPENMKFDGEGQLNIFDFGLAKLATSPGTTALYFSPGYTAPEAFNLNPAGVHTFTPAVDVYAFGCVVVWLLNGGTLPAQLAQFPPVLPVPGFSFATLAPGLPVQVAALLDRCLDADPTNRPSMSDLRAEIAAELLRGTHRLLLTFNGRDQVLHSGNASAKLTVGANSVSIQYDGLSFILTAVTGTVLVNNAVVAVGHKLTGSSVIVMGGPTGRTSITADLSHPEVML